MPITIAVPNAQGGVDNVEVDLGTSTQYGSVFGVNHLSQDGFTTGRLTSIEVSPISETSFAAILRRMRRTSMPTRVRGSAGVHWMKSGTAIGPNVTPPATGMRFVPLRDDHLGEQHFSIVFHCPVDRLQDLDRPLVVPIVDDVLEEIDVGTRRQRFEKIAFYELTTIGNARLLDTW